ncbi:MAG: hypothetical protein QM705_15950 [Ancrocorticia sp.]
MSTPTPEEARALLDQAARADSTAKSGASWPQIAMLLGIGGASSLALPAIAYVPKEIMVLPMILLGVWIATLLAFSFVFGRSVKQGFGKRWSITMGLWTIVWIVGVSGASWEFPGRIWFVVVASAALTIITLVGAWLEARR